MYYTADNLNTVISVAVANNIADMQERMFGLSESPNQEVRDSYVSSNADTLIEILDSNTRGSMALEMLSEIINDAFGMTEKKEEKVEEKKIRIYSYAGNILIGRDIISFLKSHGYTEVTFTHRPIPANTEEEDCDWMLQDDALLVAEAVGQLSVKTPESDIRRFIQQNLRHLKKEEDSASAKIDQMIEWAKQNGGSFDIWTDGDVIDTQKAEPKIQGWSTTITPEEIEVLLPGFSKDRQISVPAIDALFDEMMENAKKEGWVIEMKEPSNMLMYMLPSSYELYRTAISKAITIWENGFGADFSNDHVTAAMNKYWDMSTGRI